MDISMNERQSAVGRLAAIAEGLASRKCEPAELQAAREQLQEAAASLGEGESNDWSDAVNVLGDLLEIASCSLGDMEGDQSGRLIDCIAQGVGVLRDGLSDAGDGTGPLREFLDAARREWSDCLAVVDPGEAADFDDGNESGGDDWNDNAGVSPAPEDVEMILSTLGGAVPRTDAAIDNVPKHLFDPGSRSANRVSPSNDVPDIDDVEIEAELLFAYLSDAEQCLSSMEQAVLEFESGGGNEAVQQLCRELHTLKGASASVGLTNLAGHLHEVEEWLEQVGTPDNLDLVLSCIDAVREWVARQHLPGTAPTDTTQNESHEGHPPQSAVSGFTATGGSASDMDDSLRVKASQVDRLMDLLADMVMLRSRRDRHASQAGAIHEELQGCIARLRSRANASESFRHHDAADVAELNAESRSLREGHLSEIAGDLTEVARALKDLHDPLVEENRTLSQFIRQFRHELMELRRLPVAGLFRRLQRAVRDAARVEEKQVRLNMSGEHAGLERSVQEKLYEPLLHLVRNSVSHGIESEQDRVAAGKDPVGTITLEAMGSAQLLVMEIRDDGRGLDYEAIRRRGIERGLISADDQASNSQLAKLIFHPGFSTREQANAVAGRGVGMDVVASTLRRMHARIDVESDPGRGTTIRLRIPLRSVIEHTMVFRCGGQLFALPVQSVRAVTEDDWRKVREETGTPAEPVRLGKVLGLRQQRAGDAGHCLVIGQSPVAASPLIRKQGSRRASPAGEQKDQQTASPRTVAVLVDEILGPDEVVVRSLPPLLRRHPLLAGATLSGGGDVVQLLEHDRLVETCLACAGDSPPRPTATSANAAEFLPTGSLKVLVADDSLSARRSLVQKLLAHGFDVHEAGDGFEALDRLRAEHFDIVFSDLEMPRMGGFDLLAEVRSHRKTRNLPVVIVTTRGEEEYRARARELGTTGYMTKPVSAPDLERLLEQLYVSIEPIETKDHQA